MKGHTMACGATHAPDTRCCPVHSCTTLGWRETLQALPTPSSTSSKTCRLATFWCVELWLPSKCR